MLNALAPSLGSSPQWKTLTCTHVKLILYRYKNNLEDKLHFSRHCRKIGYPYTQEGMLVHAHCHMQRLPQSQRLSSSQLEMELQNYKTHRSVWHLWVGVGKTLATLLMKITINGTLQLYNDIVAGCYAINLQLKHLGSRGRGITITLGSTWSIYLT